MICLYLPFNLRVVGHDPRCGGNREELAGDHYVATITRDFESSDTEGYTPFP
jgi:hypothetical protein